MPEQLTGRYSSNLRREGAVEDAAHNAPKDDKTKKNITWDIILVSPFMYIGFS